MKLYPKPTLSKFREEILAYFTQHPNRPVLIGQIALLTRRSCKEAEEYLEDLRAEGLLRSATEAELKQHTLVCGYYRARSLDKAG